MGEEGEGSRTLVEIRLRDRDRETETESARTDRDILCQLFVSKDADASNQ